MSAPKPRVLRLPSGQWTWRCDCGACYMVEGVRIRVPHWHLIENATIHSRTHTAERVAAQLDEWAGKRTDSRAGGAYWEGYLEGAALAQRDAADFIRKHLVGGAS